MPHASHLSDVQVYASDFEVPLLESSRRFYSDEASEGLKRCSCPEYLSLAARRLSEEAERCHAYMDPASEGKLLQVRQGRDPIWRMRGPLPAGFRWGIHTRSCRLVSDSRIATGLHVQVVRQEMIQAKVNEVVGMPGSGMSVMLAGGKAEQLSAMYSLLCQVPGGLKAMCDALQAHVTTVSSGMRP